MSELNIEQSGEKKDKNGSSKRFATHLYLNDKFLTSIQSLKGYDNLNVLYLHNNIIKCIENLQHLRELRNLYLQNNKIEKIENLDSLNKLERLYLGHNKISVIENINLYRLQELHLEKQKLDKGESLCFNPQTIQNLSHLQFLNVSDNNIKTIAYLASLTHLRTFLASNNNISDIQDILNTIKHWMYIENIKLSDNPISKQHRYKENIIASTYRLHILDGKVVNDYMRCFIKRFSDQQLNKASRYSLNISSNFPDLPSNFAPPLQKAVSSAIMKKSFHNFTVNPTVVSQNLNKFIPWKSMPPKPVFLKKKEKNVTVQDQHSELLVTTVYDKQMSKNNLH